MVHSKRFHKELYISNHISHRNVVSLIGVWSTEAHPFCLVYEYMANFDLGQYLRGEPGVGRLMLVLTPMLLRSVNRLTILATAGRSSPWLGLLTQP